MQIKTYLWLSAILFTVACGPQTTEKTTSTEVPTEEKTQELPEISEDPCATFNDSKRGKQAIDNYVIYRDFIEMGDWEGAYENWSKVYELAPAADGQRSSVFQDGVKFYHHFFQEEEDEERKREYIDKAMAMYDRMAECYPEDSHPSGQKAFDYYYKYRDYVSDRKIFNLFKEEYDKHGKDIPVFVVNPFVALMNDMYADSTLSTEEAQKYSNLVLEAIDYNLKNCEKEECDSWDIVNGYSPDLLQRFEAVRGFYDCDYFKDKYLAEWQENPSDCEASRRMLARLKYAGCAESDSTVQKVITSIRTNCKVTESNPAIECYRNGDYACAIDNFIKQAEETTDREKKASSYYKVAQIYYAHLKNFPQARKYALKAAEHKENWGEPYLLIGNLYASSGPLCGPGRGFMSQRVVWAAIDKWSYAKKIDPSVADEAQKNINRYYQYMPTREDIFQRRLKEGESYYIDCWIRESTRIRVR